jgi:guanine deaminase
MGLRIGLGSDAGGGPTLSPFEVMRSAMYVHTARRFLPDFRSGDIPSATAFYLATLGGAQALGLDGRIGSLTCGKEADFIIVNPQKLSPVPTEKATDISPETLFSRMIFLGDDRIVEQTYVRGVLCHDRRSHGNNERQS